MNSAKFIASLLASWAVAMAALVAFGGILHLMAPVTAWWLGVLRRTGMPDTMAMLLTGAPAGIVVTVLLVGCLHIATRRHGKA